ncbi:hypothetical protein [Bdellovibrio sp. KM01]|uniref:hypothetical protein n=1 Tax=Bdellovibrio sp. KM01 TaxID=2748865 RepID=UPI0015E9B97D|nr:hypothetical protein [Bdellovibrio sp. KM01]QLY25832.1 hypothetical protein HW988_01950 [Bdellovibrio sp. KM01]
MKKILLAFAMILGSSSVFAAEGTSTSDVFKTDRVGKNWMIAGQLVGMTSKVGSESGVIAGVYFNPDSLLLVEAYGAEETGFWHNLDGDVKIKSQSIAVMYKKFLGNSFYMKMGAVGRSIDYSNYEIPQDEKFKGTSIAASFGLGNQWQIKNFTLGADWISFSQPISTNITSEQIYDNTTYAQQSMDDAQNTYLKSSYFQFVRFYVGASF